MKKRFLPILLLCILCLAALRPLGVQAVEPLDPNRDASLTLHYQKDGEAFPDIPVASTGWRRQRRTALSIWLRPLPPSL